MKIRAFLDTNAIMDMLVAGRPEHDEAVMIRRLVTEGTVIGGAASVSLKDMYYLTRKTFVDEHVRRGFVRLMLDTFDIQDVSALTCRLAADSDEPDFEDGLVRMCAECWDADVIISRDAAAFANSRIPMMGPSAFIANYRAS